MLKRQHIDISLSPLIRYRSSLLVGITLTLSTISYYYAIQFASVSTAVILLNTAPIFLLIIIPFILGKTIDNRIFIPLLLSFIGLLFLVYTGSEIASTNLEIIGLACGLISGLLYAIGIIMIKKTKQIPPAQLVYVQTIVSAVIFLPFVVFMPHSINVLNLILLCLMGILNTALALTLFFHAIQSIQLGHIGVLWYVQSLFIVILAAFFLRVIPPFITILGCLFILAGAYLIMKQK